MKGSLAISTRLLSFVAYIACMIGYQDATPVSAFLTSDCQTQNNMDLIDEQLKHDSDVIFSILDCNSSDSISKNEFSKHLRRIGYSAPSVNQLFDEIDANGDSAISPSEFCTLYMAVPSLRTLPGLHGTGLDPVCNRGE